ncbi:MAG TPA: RraA family protein [Bordetella sp.]
MSTTLLRVLEQPLPRVDDALLKRYAEVGCAQISDCMNRLYGVVSLAPYHDTKGPRMVGIALTVKARPGDNLFIHKAITLARPGDVIVVDGGGDLTNALVGELMAMEAERRGVRGFVIDGSVRDADVFAKNGNFGCFARGVSHRGPYKDGPGEINVPVSIGGLVVLPGDVVVGDADGVMAIPAGMAELVLGLAEKKEAAEVQSKEKIRNGTNARPWIDQAIARLNGQG